MDRLEDAGLPRPLMVGLMKSEGKESREDRAGDAGGGSISRIADLVKAARF